MKYIQNISNILRKQNKLLMNCIFKERSELEKCKNTKDRRKLISAFFVIELVMELISFSFCILEYPVAISSLDMSHNASRFWLSDMESPSR